MIMCYLPQLHMLSQVTLDTLSVTILNLSLKINVQNSSHIVLRHENRIIVSDVKIQNPILKTVTECKYLGVVLSDDLTSTKDVERVKASFFKQFFSHYNKFCCMDQKVLIQLLELHALSFYGVETWFMKLHTTDLNNILIAYHKAIKRMCNKRPYDSNQECLEKGQSTNS